LATKEIALTFSNAAIRAAEATSMAAAAKSTTKVVTEFTDKAGRKWKIGEPYTGNDTDKQAAIAAGQVQEAPADPAAGQ
jgi:hypothetical protein